MSHPRCSNAGNDRLGNATAFGVRESLHSHYFYFRPRKSGSSESSDALGRRRFPAQALQRGIAAPGDTCCAPVRTLANISTAARSGTPVTPANEPGLTLPPRHRSASLGIESVGTTAGDGGIALFHPKRARAALVSSRELSYARFQYTIR